MFDVSAEAPKNFGLRSMRERVTLLGGTFTVSSEPGTGTRVTADLPFIARAATAAG